MQLPYALRRFATKSRWRGLLQKKSRRPPRKTPTGSSTQRGLQLTFSAKVLEFRAATRQPVQIRLAANAPRDSSKFQQKKCTNVYQAFRDDDAFGGNEWRDLTTSDAPAENQRKDRTDARSRASGADISCCRTGSSRRAPLSELALERRCRKHRRKMIARSAEEDWALGCWTGVSVRFGKPETKTQR